MSKNGVKNNVKHNLSSIVYCVQYIQYIHVRLTLAARGFSICSNSRRFARARWARMRSNVA
jgi:phage terminase small subunit